MDQIQPDRMKVAPDTVAYADGAHHQLIVEFAIPGARAQDQEPVRSLMAGSGK